MISLTDTEHRYGSGTTVSMPEINLKQGEHLLILGSSGSGKSTLLHVLAGLLQPTRGLLKIDGVELYSLSESERDRFRDKNIGVIFQQLHLVDAVNVLENVILAQYMAGISGGTEKARLILEELEILDKEKSYISELSQGQKQRTGIARALVNSPKLLMADEPTSSLDDLF